MTPRHALRPFFPSAQMSSARLLGALAIASLFCSLASPLKAQTSVPTAPANIPLMKLPAALGDPVLNATGGAAAIRPLVNAYIAGCMPALAMTNSSANQAAAREALLRMIVAKPPAVRAAAFKSVFASELNSALMAAGSPLNSPDDRVRLNVAIVVARTAQQVLSGDLEPTILALLKDKNEAVVIWALKAAQSSLAPQLVTQVSGVGKTALPAAISATIVAYPKSGAIITGVYQALAVPTDVVPAQFRGQVETIVVGEIQEILTTRLALYAAGNPGPDPLADQTATLYLTTKSVWDSFPAPAGKVVHPMNEKSLQLIVSLAEKVASLLNAAAPDQVTALTSMSAEASKAVYVALNNNMGNANSAATISPATKIDPNAPTPAAEVQRLVKLLAPGVQAAVKSFVPLP